MFSLSEEEQCLLLKLARATLVSLLAQTKAPRTEAFPARLQENHPCFVTLLTKSERLRGCIGTTSHHHPLCENIVRFAEQAAFHDPRFRPLEVRELSQIVIHISVLGPLVPLENPDSLQLGKQGLVVSYKDHRGLLLADLPVRYQWSVEGFMNQTCQKAGLDPASAKLYRWECFDEISFSE